MIWLVPGARVIGGSRAEGEGNLDHWIPRTENAHRFLVPSGKTGASGSSGLRHQAPGPTRLRRRSIWGQKIRLQALSVRSLFKDSLRHKLAKLPQSPAPRAYPPWPGDKKRLSREGRCKLNFDSFPRKDSSIKILSLPPLIIHKLNIKKQTDTKQK